MSPSSCIAVVGASGGVGSSTISLAIGRRLAVTGPPSIVVDLDLGGGGLDVTAGIEHLPGRRWPALADVRGHVDAGLLAASLPHEDGCRVLSAGGPSRGPLPDRAVVDVLASLCAVGRVVVDVGRAPVPQAVLGDGVLVLLVVSLRTRGLADADARLEALLDSCAPAAGPPDVRLVTRGGRPGRDVLDDVVAHLGVAHLCHCPDDAGVVRDAERGLWPGTHRDAVRRVADAVVAAVDSVEAAS